MNINSNNIANTYNELNITIKNDPCAIFRILYSVFCINKTFTYFIFRHYCIRIRSLGSPLTHRNFLWFYWLDLFLLQHFYIKYTYNFSLYDKMAQSRHGKTRRESYRESVKDVIHACLLTGSTVIPCYSTGDSETLRPTYTGYAAAAVSTVLSILPISVCVFQGRWGLPLPNRWDLVISYLVINDVTWCHVMSCDVFCYIMRVIQ